MLRTRLVEVLRARFPDAGFSFHPDDRLCAVLPAAHADVGDLRVFDDGAEATVEVGELTHGHVGCWESADSKDEADRRVADSVAALVDALVSGKVVLWSAGASSGWRWLDDEAELPPLPASATLFSWAGPVAR